jgi:hypothetical protein
MLTGRAASDDFGGTDDCCEWTLLAQIRQRGHSRAMPPRRIGEFKPEGPRRNAPFRAPDGRVHRRCHLGHCLSPDPPMRQGAAGKQCLRWLLSRQRLAEAQDRKRDNWSGTFQSPPRASRRARKALRRWEMRFFSSSVISPYVRPSPSSGMKAVSQPNPLSPRGSAAIVP